MLEQGGINTCWFLIFFYIFYNVLIQSSINKEEYKYVLSMKREPKHSDETSGYSSFNLNKLGYLYSSAVLSESLKCLAEDSN